MADIKAIKISEEFKNGINKKFKDSDGIVVGMVSGKGGVGKTTISSLLGYALAAEGAAVLVMDMDTGLRNLDIVIGVEDMIVANLFDVLERGDDFADAALKAPGSGDPNENLPWVCFSDHLKIKNAIGSAPFYNLLTELKKIFDIIILDAPAGIEYGCRLVTDTADHINIVCNCGKASLRSVEQISSMVHENAPVELIVNKVIPDLIKNNGGMSLEDIELFTGLPVTAAIPLDLSVEYCAQRGVSAWYLSENASELPRHMRNYAKDLLAKFFGAAKEVEPEVKAVDAADSAGNTEAPAEAADKHGDASGSPARDEAAVEKQSNAGGVAQPDDEEEEPEEIKEKEPGVIRSFFSRLFGRG